MHIQNITLHRIELRFKTPYATSFGVHVTRQLILAEVQADGLTGWGEWAGDGPGYSYETVDAAWLILHSHLLPMLHGATLTHPNEVAARLAAVRGYPFAKAMLEAAIWDIAAQQAGQSLSRFIGGTRANVVAGVSVGIQPDPAATVARVQSLLRYPGIGRVKLKIKPGHDLAHVAALRHALRREWPDLPLMVDANAAYTLADLDTLRRLDAHNLLMIEQPLAADDWLDHAELQRHLRSPICLDESITSLAQAKAALALGACRVVNIKPGRVGGLSAAIAIHDFCHAAGIPVWCGGMFETGIGRALNLALASLPGFTLPGDFTPAQRLFGRDLIDPPIEANADGTLPVPSDVGLGVRVRIGD